LSKNNQNSIEEMLCIAKTIHDIPNELNTEIIKLSLSLIKFKKVDE